MNDAGLLLALRRDGVVKLPGTLAGVAELTAWLKSRPVVPTHVPWKSAAQPVPFDQAQAGQWPMFCHSMADVVNAPHMLGLSLFGLDFARAYLEAEPLVYSLNAFWTQPSSAGRYKMTHKWHRDGDDARFLVLYVYGEDVLTPDDGPHLFLRGTHAQTDSEIPADRAALTETLLGPAGTMFLADARGLHIGQRPLHKLRSLLWVRWGVTDPPASYLWDRMSPVPRQELRAGVYPENSAQQRAIRLVAA